jgi:hypothetical protein
MKGPDLCHGMEVGTTVAAAAAEAVVGRWSCRTRVRCVGVGSGVALALKAACRDCCYVRNEVLLMHACRCSPGCIHCSGCTKIFKVVRTGSTVGNCFVIYVVYYLLNS